MAIKRRSKNEDDEDGEERPRRKSRDDDDDDDDDDDRPAKRRKSKAEADDDEDRPSKRRKARDDDDDEDDDDRPVKRRKKKDEEDEDDEVEDVEDLDESDAPGEELSYEEQLKEFNRKKVVYRKQMEALSEGLTTFKKRIQLYLGCLVGVAAGNVLAYLGKAMFGELALAVPGLAGLGIYLGLPLLGIKAAKQCKDGPPRSDGGSLTTIMSVNAAMFILPLHVFSFIYESIFLKNVSRFVKDKIQGNNAQALVVQHILVEIVGPIIVVVAAIFLIPPDKVLFNLIFLIIFALWVLFIVKVFTEMMGVISGLQVTIAKRLKAEDTPEW